MPADLTADDRAALESVVSQLEAAWNAMDGPAFAGKRRARFSLVLTKVAGRWEIAALHNTLEAVQGPPR